MVLGGVAGTPPTIKGSIPRHLGARKSKASAAEKRDWLHWAQSSGPRWRGVEVTYQDISREQNTQKPWFKGRSHREGTEDHIT